ncbi:MAG: anhydro-N-acetylmuramic acid kinase [Marinosulfonomonas sp.]
MLKEGPVWALGMMSGTSLDGVDAAMLLTDGVSILEFGETGYRPYTDQERAVLQANLGKWDDTDEAAEIVETAHAELLSQFEGAELIGFHGQTLAHDPHGRGTYQVGNGALLAEVAELPVVWDFRSADVEMGGEGAPLAPFFHFACAKWIGAKRPVVFLNLGGVGNVTWVDPSKDIPNEEDAILSFDTGPANAPIDDLIHARRGLRFDEGGALAKEGKVSEGILAAFVEEPYFFKRPPKSLDRGDFARLVEAVGDLSDADAVATLTAAASAAVARGADHFPTAPAQVLVTGGGRKNPVLMSMLEAGLNSPVVATEFVGLNGDMLEAQAFAYLAVRVARGMPTSCPATTGVPAAIGGGVVSRFSG